MSEKKIEVFKVIVKTTDKSELNFEDILLNIDFHKVDIKSGPKYSQLNYVEDKGDYIVGMIQTTKMNATPPKRNVETDVVSPLGLIKEEGLLYGNVFLYYKAKKALIYEVTRDSLFIGQLDSFIYALVKDSELIKFSIRFNSMMKPDAMKKLLTMGDRKSIHMQFAYPDELIKKIKNNQSSLKEIAKPGKDIGAELIDVTYKISGNKGKFLQNGKINQMLEYIGDKYSLVKDNIKEFTIKGYTEDEENITEVDLIKDVMVDVIKYQEDKNMEDLKPFQRKQEIIAAFKRLETDINTY